MPPLTVSSRSGTTQTIGGIETYVATPTGDYPKDKVVLYLLDAFGLKLENNLVKALPFLWEERSKFIQSVAQ